MSFAQLAKSKLPTAQEGQEQTYEAPRENSDTTEKSSISNNESNPQETFVLKSVESRPRDGREPELVISDAIKSDDVMASEETGLATGDIDGRGGSEGSDSTPLHEKSESTETGSQTGESLIMAEKSHIDEDLKDIPQADDPPLPPPKDEHLLEQPRQPLLPITTQDESPWHEKSSYEATESTSAERAADNIINEKQHRDGSEESRLEIQNIMEQFQDQTLGERSEDMGSPSSTTLPVFQYPPRVSSLEHLSQQTTEPFPQPSSSKEITDPSYFPESMSGRSLSKDSETSSMLSRTTSIVSQPPPPAPDPEPDLPFDFHRFLDQLRHRTADPVAKFLRSFLTEFGKRQWQVHEQVKLIRDFLTFIANKMAQCDVWRTVSDAEFDNAKEGMEKLVMNRLYSQTFSPEIPPADPNQIKARRKGAPNPPVPGRKGQHQEDVERDDVLAQKVRIYGWIREEHLDIQPAEEKGTKFLRLAQQELLKIKSYRAPRDKVICILNCCKVLFGFLRNTQSDQSADSFIPLLIYTVLKANPDHLVSNVQYILRFRNQEKLTGEAGYYMSSLMGAIQFIENLDRTSLTVSDEEFEKNVEAAVSAIAERHEHEEKRNHNSTPIPFNEKSSLSRPVVTPRHSLEGEQSSPRKALNRTDTHSDDSDDNAAVAGLLRTIQRPLTTIGRIFSDDSSVPQSNASASLLERPGSTPQSTTRTPPQSSGTPQNGLRPEQQVPQQTPQSRLQTRSPQRPGGNVSTDAETAEVRNRVTSEEAAVRQASEETAEAHRIQRAEHQTIVDTLSGMFPDLDKDVISDVVRMKEGRVGLAVDACLALSR